MALRGALNRSINIGLGILLLALPCWAVYFMYSRGSIAARAVLISTLVAYPLGVLAGLPAFVLNRKALTELYHVLTGKMFLSSQLALLDSRHGKNAVAYFYVVVCLAILSFPFWPRVRFLEGGGGWFLQGAYLSANVLPFVLPPKRKVQ